MKKYASVTMAAVRPIVWKLLLIILAMAVCETGLFLWQWNHSLRVSASPPDCLMVLSGFYLRVVYSLALMALTAVILLQGNWLAPGKPGYTMRRMPASEGGTALIWTGIYLAAYLILRAAQLLVILGIWKLYGDGGQFRLMMEFYAGSFFHGLFPMENLARHIRNLVWTLSMSAVLSGAAYARRRGINQIGPFLLLAVELAFMGGGIELMGLEICLMVFIVLVACVCVYNAWRSGYEEN